MGIYAPEAAGGLGMSRLDASMVVEELARGCTATAAFLTIHNMATSMVGLALCCNRIRLPMQV